MKDKKHEEINVDRQHDKQKEMQKNKENNQSAKCFCMGCKKEIFPSFHCACSGGGGASDGGAGGGGSSEEKSDLKSTGTSQSADISGKQMPTSEVNVKDWGAVVQPVLTPKETMLLIIADLLEKNLLKIDDNKGLCILTIKCDPKLLSEIEKKAVNDYVKEIKKELAEFKNKNGLSDKDCLVKTVKDKQGNVISLSINIPNPKLYAAFIEHLSDKNLLAPTRLEKKERETSDKTSAFNPTPFKKKPTPPNWEE